MPLQRIECGSTRRDNHLRIPILGAKVVAPDVRLRFERIFKVEIPAKESWDSRSVTSGEGVQSWYTDGSKSVNTKWSEAGVYRQDTNKRAYFSLGGGRPSYQAKLFAILQVATRKEVTEGREGVIEIYSDSQAVLKALCKARLIQECWDTLNKVVAEAVWIPEHMGFAESEHADALALLGSSEIPITSHRIKQQTGRKRTK